MTGSAPTPQAMTLEELVTLHGLTFWCSPVTSAWAAGRIKLLSPHSPTMYSHAWEPHGVGATWAEAASQALGYPVVPRDDTAELHPAASWSKADISERLLRLEGALKRQTDDTAELIQAVEAYLAAEERFEATYEPGDFPTYDDDAHAHLYDSRAALYAVLARVKGETT